MANQNDHSGSPSSKYRKSGQKSKKKKTKNKIQNTEYIYTYILILKLICYETVKHTFKPYQSPRIFLIQNLRQQP